MIFNSIAPLAGLLLALSTPAFGQLSNGDAVGVEVREEEPKETKWQKAQRAKAKVEFPGRKRKVLIETGHRHLKLGVWCRNKGMNSQATMEFLMAVEVSEHRHPGAERVLKIMRGYGDDFWKKNRKSVPKSLLDHYERRVVKLAQRNSKQRFELAEWALEFGIPEGAQEFRALVALKDGPLEFDKKERITVAGGAVPLDISQTIRANAVTINGRLWLRDDFLSQVPGVESIVELENDRIRVRTMGTRERAQDVLDACTALLPVLAKDTGGRPTDRLNLFLFEKKGAYSEYLVASGMTDFEGAQGFALSSTRTACLNTFEMSDEDVRALALHEITHLFVYGTTRTRMPDWYSEGLAETYGGQGCHVIEKGKFNFHQVMAPHRLALLRQGQSMPLRELLNGDALALRAKGGNALEFYAQSWAFLRFMRTEANDDAREKFVLWETVCRGKALGAVLGKSTEDADVGPAQALFSKLFDAELDSLEVAFLAYLKTI